MKRLVFIVEGPSEVQFVKFFLIPYLAFQKRLARYPMTVQQLFTNRKEHIRGGNVSFGKFSNDVIRVAHQGEVLITTLIDFFRLPNSFPEYAKDGKYVDEIEQAIRLALAKDVSPSIFLPYIQLHEFEALLFSNMDGFKAIIEDNKKALAKLELIEREYDNPEDINGGEETAPSKRLERIFNYQKVSDSFIALSEIPIDVIRGKCPRFNNWVMNLEEGLIRGFFAV